MYQMMKHREDTDRLGHIQREWGEGTRWKLNVMWENTKENDMNVK